MSEAATARRLVPIDEVSGMLASHVEQLVLELLPAGRRNGQEWCVGSLAGEPGQSLRVHLGGAKAGVWKEFNGHESGDALDLVAQVLFRGDKRQGLRWALNWLGIAHADTASLEVARRAVVARKATEDEAGKKKRNAAFRLWLEAAANIAGTPAEYYLAGRGIDLAALGRQPRAIRFHARCWNSDVQRFLPAMVTAIGAADGAFMACHRTYLEEAGPGDWRKARLEDAKKTLGGWAGGFIRLWRGASGKPLAAAPAGEVVDMSEGIEDGLSVAMAMPEARIVAAVSIDNIANLKFPPQITTLRIWRQNDTKTAAIAAFDRVVQAQLRAGMKVLIPRLPDGVKDANEWLQQGGV